MKYILLACTLLVPHAFSAHHYPLCPESKQFIVNSAIAGGIVGGGIGLIAAFDKQSHEKHSKHASTWDKIKAFPWHYVILPAVAGAAGAAFVASFFTTEEYLKSAEQELALLENNVLLDKAMHTDDAAQLKKLAYASQYPTLTTYERLEALLQKITKAKEYLFTVIKSGTSPLISIAQAALERLKAMEQRIINWMITLKDKNYLDELKIRSDIDFKNQMADAAYRSARAAEAQAKAAQSAAHAAWHHAHPVYVAPPAVNVYLKK